MDIDGSSIQPQSAEDIDQNLLLQFSCMNTSDKDELVGQMQKLLGPSMNHNTASFFLDMSNWNLQAAICSYLDYSLPPKLPSMALIKCENHEVPIAPGTGFEQKWTIANTGAEQWPGMCRIIQAGGENLEGEPVPVPPLLPGDTATVPMCLVAPCRSGTHKGFFHLLTDKGDKFGDTLWAEINVESEITMALVEQLAAMPVPSSRMEDNVSQTPSQDDQMC